MTIHKLSKTLPKYIHCGQCRRHTWCTDVHNKSSVFRSQHGRWRGQIPSYQLWLRLPSPGSHPLAPRSSVASGSVITTSSTFILPRALWARRSPIRCGSCACAVGVKVRRGAPAAATTQRTEEVSAVKSTHPEGGELTGVSASDDVSKSSLTCGHERWQSVNFQQQQWLAREARALRPCVCSNAT